MYDMDHHMVRVQMNLSIEEAKRQARACDLARQVKRQTPGWFSRVGGWLLGQLGSELVALGQRLERHAPARPLVREGT